MMVETWQSVIEHFGGSSVVVAFEAECVRAFLFYGVTVPIGTGDSV